MEGDSVCFTAVNPFHVRLLKHDKRRGEAEFRLSRKRVKSPTKKVSRKGENETFKTEKSPSVDASKLHKSMEMSSQPNCKFSVKVGKINGLRCTPDGKKRRRSRLVDLHSAG